MKSLIWLLLVFTFLITFPSWAEDEEKTLSGTVTGIDWVSSTISVRHTLTSQDDPDEISLKIPHSAVMTRGVKSISFLDILLQDQVVVTYYDAGLSGLKVKRLTDLNLAHS